MIIDYRFKNEKLIGTVFRCKRDDKTGRDRFLYGEGARVLKITDTQVEFENTTEENIYIILIEEFRNHFELFI